MPRTPKKPAETLAPVADAVLDQFGPAAGMSMAEIRDEGVVRSKAVYLALAVFPDGRRDILGIWIEQTEGAKFWLKVFTDLKTRGCDDILIAVTDGLKGMPDALEAVYPQTTLQTCIVHLIRRSLDFAGYQDRRALAAALRPIYTAPSAEAAASALDAVADGPWGARFPMVVKGWRTAWAQVVPFFAFPPDVRRVIYTTNALESVHAGIRRIIKARGHFPTDDAATKLIWFALRNLCGSWTAPAQRWKPALSARSARIVMSNLPHTQNSCHTLGRSKQMGPPPTRRRSAINASHPGVVFCDASRGTSPAGRALGQARFGPERVRDDLLPRVSAKTAGSCLAFVART